MRRLKNKVIAILIAVLLIFASLLFFDGQWRNKYNISATVENEKLQGNLLLEYKSEQALEQICFCLYPNAFKNEENINNVCAPEMVDKAYPNGFSSGYIEIKSVKVNDKKVDFSLEQDEQILVVDTHVKKNKKILVEIEFAEKLPNSPMRYGYFENTFNYGNWYPILCPIEDGQAVKSVYLANGDPFYSECADYSVMITTPQNLRLATSGKILSCKETPIEKTYKIEGKNIRDFAFVLSEKFDVISKKIGNTIVYSYYFSSEDCGKQMLDYAANALQFFSQKFGEYPYETYSVVESDFYIGGMEYPNLVLVSGELAKNQSSLEEVVVHETAHQWWYGIVGNNEVSEPWLDEGLTQYSTALYYENRYGKDKYKSYMQQSEAYVKVILKLLKETDVSIEGKIDKFKNMLLYDAIVYDTASIMFDTLRTVIGQDSFDECIKLYFEQNKFKVATKQSFMTAIKTIAGNKAIEIVEAFLKGKVFGLWTKKDKIA